MDALLDKLLAAPALRLENLPSTAQVTLLWKANPDRLIVHLLYYPLTPRVPDIDMVEEPRLVEDVRRRVRMAAKPSRVLLVPLAKALAFDYSDG